MKKILIYFFLLIISISTIAFIYYFSASRPVSTVSQNQIFVVNKGDSLTIIASRLQKTGLIRNSFIFKLNSYILGLHNKLRAGNFNLDPSMDNQQIINSLVTGGSKDVWIQIIEGLRNEEIATYLDENDLYSGKSFLYLAKHNQGYIYPDTYSIPQTNDVDFFIKKTLQNFDQKYQKILAESNTDKDKNETVIIASLLEREARTLASKQMISGILNNRLSIGMPLQLDATVQYAVDSQNKPKQYWQPISKSDLSINSPYNTYQVPGLPPTPICNPGYDSLFAAINPIESDYLYYITGSDNLMHYSKTLEEHNQNIRDFL